MTLVQKLDVADKLGDIDCRVDLSGGEVMVNPQELFAVLERLSQKLGKERVGVSCSGWGIDEAAAARLAALVGDVEMTMDAHPDYEFSHRPNGYHQTAAEAAILLKRHGVKVGIQTVITREHLKNVTTLVNLYGWLCDNGVDEWSILKFYPSGRGADFPQLALSDDENKRVVSYVRSMDMFRGDFAKPQLDIHYLMPGTPKNTECRCVRKSVGILPDGTVTACFWGLSKGNRLSESQFYLGDARVETMQAILNGEKARYWCHREGGCALIPAATAAVA